jgi:hypothetical protein
MRHPDKRETEEELPEIEKNDSFAMWIAGVLTVGLPIAGLLALIAGLFILVFH